MDILKMLEELRAERQHIEEAIQVVERLAAGTLAKRRGRPPKWMAASHADPSDVAPVKKRTVSAAARRKMAEAQQRRWAGKKAAAKESGS